MYDIHRMCCIIFYPFMDIHVVVWDFNSTNKNERLRDFNSFYAIDFKRYLPFKFKWYSSPQYKFHTIGWREYLWIYWLVIVTWKVFDLVLVYKVYTIVLWTVITYQLIGMKIFQNVRRLKWTSLWMPEDSSECQRISRNYW